MASLQISESDLTSVKDKVAIITGGGAGIGLATSLLFSRLGAHVFIADLRPPPEAIPNATFVKTDVTSWAELSALFSQVHAAHGRIDIVLANAGVGEIEDVFKDTFDEEGKLKEPRYVVLDINLRGVVNCVKLAVYYMKQGGGGSIVMTGSTASYLSEPIPMYQAAKHGLLGLMRAVRKTFLAKHNVTINLVAPYMTESNLMLPDLRVLLERDNFVINEPLSVAKALAYSAVANTEKGARWNGRTIYVYGNTFTELEEGIQTLQPQWLGYENSRVYNAADEADYFGQIDQTKGK